MGFRFEYLVHFPELGKTVPFACGCSSGVLYWVEELYPGQDFIIDRKPVSVVADVSWNW